MSIFKKRSERFFFSCGKKLALESLEERNLLSAAAWLPTYNSYNDTVTFTGVYHSDADVIENAGNISELKIVGYYSSEYIAHDPIQGEADISFANVYDFGLSTLPVTDINKLVQLDSSNEDQDSATDSFYEISWKQDFTKPDKSVFLCSVTYKFDTARMANGEQTNINFVVTESIGDTSVEIGNASFVIANNNGNMEPGTITPSLIWGNTKVIALNAAQAEAGKLIANFKSVRFTPTTYSYTINGLHDNNNIFLIDANGLKLVNAASGPISYENIVITASDGTNTKSLAGFDLMISDASVSPIENSLPDTGTNLSESQSPDEEYNIPTWNVAGLGYRFYEITATNNDNVYSTSLYGRFSADGAKTLLQTFDNISAQTNVLIIGNAQKEEDLHVTQSAVATLGEICFQGGGSRLDHVSIDGTEEHDIFTLDGETSTVISPVSIVNPYENLLNYYRNFYGEASTIYQNIANVFNTAYQRLKSIALTNQSEYFNTVASNNGAIIKVSGVQNIAINGAEGDDTFNVVNLGTNYDLIGGASINGDAINFKSPNIKRVAIDMGSQFTQYAVTGQAGTIRLHGDIEEVTGSRGSDSIISADNTTAIYGNGGSDIVTLKGRSDTSTTVNLNGRSQSIIARGDGAYTINIENGNFSIVNALLATNAITLNATGDNVTFYGGRDNDRATIIGNRAYVNTGAGDDQIGINGSNATILAGAGDDFVDFGVDTNNNIFSTGNIVYGETGNDVINAFNTTGYNYLYAGVGNDKVIGGIGSDFIYGMSGNNILIGNTGQDRIFGGTGRDIIMASGTTKLNDSEKSDEQKLWILNAVMNELTKANPVTKVINELLGDSLKDNARDWLYRGAGFGNYIYLNSKTDGDFASALTFSPFNDQFFDDLEDVI